MMSMHAVETKSLFAVRFDVLGGAYADAVGMARLRASQVRMRCAISTGTETDSERYEPSMGNQFPTVTIESDRPKNICSVSEAVEFLLNARSHWGPCHPGFQRGGAR